MIVLKNEREIKLMLEACRISAEALKVAGEAVEPGVSTWEIDRIARKYIESKGAKPTFLAIALDCATHITESAAGNCLFNAFVKALFGSFYQPLRFCRDISACESGSIITGKTVDTGSEVDTYYVACPYNA